MIVANPSHKTLHQINRPETNSIHESIMAAVDKDSVGWHFTSRIRRSTGLVNQYLDRARGRATISASETQILPTQAFKIVTSVIGPPSFRGSPLLTRGDPEEYDVVKGRDAALARRRIHGHRSTEPETRHGGHGRVGGPDFRSRFASAPGLDAGAALRRRGRGQYVADRAAADMDCRYRVRAAHRTGLLRRPAGLDHRRSVQP